MSEKIYCIACETEHSKLQFYQSYSPMHNGYAPWCKAFIKKEVYGEDISNSKVNLEKFKNILQQLDLPFLIDYYEGALNYKADTVGTYFKNLKLKHNRLLTWKDSIHEHSENQVVDNITISKFPKNQIIVNDALIDKWGDGYKDQEYILFEKKYKKLINNYGEKTALHAEGLLTYIRFRVKEEIATAEGNIKEAKEWGAMATKAAQDAKINVSQLSKSDISGGVDVVSQIFEAVETEIGIIPLLPRLLDKPSDEADLVLWANINYNRRLEDKSSVQYKDIWNFYNEMLDEYFSSKGYSDEQKQKYIEERNSIFKDLSEIYIEPLYNEGDE